MVGFCGPYMYTHTNFYALVSLTATIFIFPSLKRILLLLFAIISLLLSFAPFFCSLPALSLSLSLFLHLSLSFFTLGRYPRSGRGNALGVLGESRVDLLLDLLRRRWSVASRHSQGL